MFVMTAPFEALPGARRGAHPLSSLQTNTLRTALLAGREERTAEFTQHAVTLAALTADSSADGRGCHRDRAMAALHMYIAREAIEEIDDALVRMRDGGYGTCKSCAQHIAFARLEAFPGAGYCAACSGLTPRAQGS